MYIYCKKMSTFQSFPWLVSLSVLMGILFILVTVALYQSRPKPLEMYNTSVGMQQESFYIQSQNDWVPIKEGRVDLYLDHSVVEGDIVWKDGVLSHTSEKEIPIVVNVSIAYKWRSEVQHAPRYNLEVTTFGETRRHPCGAYDDKTMINHLNKRFVFFFSKHEIFKVSLHGISAGIKEIQLISNSFINFKPLLMM